MPMDAERLDAPSASSMWALQRCPGSHLCSLEAKRMGVAASSQDAEFAQWGTKVHGIIAGLDREDSRMEIGSGPARNLAIALHSEALRFVDEVVGATDIHTVFRETRMFDRFQAGGRDYVWSGAMDLAVCNKDGVWAIVDFKTFPKDDQAREEIMVQLDAYAVLIRERCLELKMPFEAVAVQTVSPWKVVDEDSSDAEAFNAVRRVYPLPEPTYLEADDVAKLAAAYRQTAVNAMDPKAPRVPGKQCRFCVGKSICREYLEVAIHNGRSVDAVKDNLRTMHGLKLSALGIQAKQYEKAVKVVIEEIRRRMVAAQAGELPAGMEVSTFRLSGGKPATRKRLQIGIVAHAISCYERPHLNEGKLADAIVGLISGSKIEDGILTMNPETYSGFFMGMLAATGITAEEYADGAAEFFLPDLQETTNVRLLQISTGC